MVIIESSAHFKDFLEVYGTHKSFMHIIQCDSDKHPLNDYPSVIYCRTNNESYILPIKHSECSEMSIEILLHLTTKQNVYVIDAKKTKHYIPGNFYDLRQLAHDEGKELVDIEDFYTMAHIFFKRKQVKDYNVYVPLVKHIEMCEELFTYYEDLMDKAPNDFYQEGNDVFSRIERNAIKTNGTLKDYDKHISKEDYVYSDYNLITSTGRPSNTFAGLNFAALNKKDDSRNFITTRFDKGILVEYDYDAYHLRLIAKLVDYDFGQESVHEHFSKIFNVDYNEAKTMSFRYLYGGIPKEVSDSYEFFGKVKTYSDKLYQKVKQTNILQTDIYNRQIRINQKDFYASKLFNYKIQNLETETNLKTLVKLSEFLEPYESKLIMYHYDSFLFDFSINDSTECIDGIKSILEREGHPVKMKRGMNYGEMN